VTGRDDTRDRLRPLKTFVTAEERAFIVGSAAICGMSVSQYLRTVGMHGRPTNMLDLEAMGKVIKASGDLGRLGGLLKLWLTDRPEAGAAVNDVRALLREIEAGVAEVRMKVREIKPLCTSIERNAASPGA
jgi:hypothetical protein